MQAPEFHPRPPSESEVSISNSHIPGGMPARQLHSSLEDEPPLSTIAIDGTVAGVPPEGAAVGGPAIGVPMGDYGMGVVPGVPVPSRSWTQPLLNYDTKTPLCWCSCLCPCVVYANNYTSFHGRRGEECTRALGFCTLCPGVPALLGLIFLFKIPLLSIGVCLPMHTYSAWYTSPLRKSIRERYGIAEPPRRCLCCSDDFCVHSFCVICAIQQERRELEADDEFLPPPAMTMQLIAPAQHPPIPPRSMPTSN